MPATRNSYTFKEGLTMMAAKAVGIDPYLAAEAGENARAAINAIRNAAKTKQPKDRAGYIREAQSELRTISAAQHPKLVNALQAKMLALQGRGGDTEVAHLTPGEMVLPRSLQTPELMKQIATLAARQGIDPRSTSLKAGIFGAEPWTNAMRDEIESSFDMHAVDIFGLSEVIGPGVANECVETKDGLHIWEDHFYPEIIDPVSGRVLPDGEKGELVFTSLTKEAMPVIRYRTRDLSRLLPGTARSMRRMEKVTGRSDDMMVVRGINVFPTQVEELLLKIEPLSAHYQIVLTRDGRMDEMEVMVEIRPDVDTPDACARSATHLGQRIKDTIGVTAKVSVIDANAIERSLGKAKRIIDKRPKG